MIFNQFPKNSFSLIEKHRVFPSVVDSPSFFSRRLAQGSFEVRPTTATAQPSQPGGEEHSLQAQQVPGLSTDPATDSLYEIP